MAEDSLVALVMPQCPNQEETQRRMNSSGMIRSSSSNKEKAVPNYLRASTGSCHDLCKYGRRLTDEDKPWRSTRKDSTTKISDHRTLGLSLESPLDKWKHSPSGRQNGGYKLLKQKGPTLHGRRELSSTQASSKPKGGNKLCFKSEAVLFQKSVDGAGTSSSTLRKASIVPRSSLSKPSVRRADSKGAERPRKLKASSPSETQESNIEQIPEAERGQANGDTSEEKTLYVVKMEAASRGSNYDDDEKSTDDFSPSLTSSSALKEEDDKEENACTVTDPEEDDSGSQGKETSSEGFSSSEESNHKVKKLNFRRGNFIHSQSENNGQQRLKFRQGRVLGENHDGCGKTKAESVVLRHQDVQVKKDPLGLLNNVIEKTANKLVGIRKSKVKALVGAFETVISLQGSNNKPSGVVPLQ